MEPDVPSSPDNARESQRGIQPAADTAYNPDRMTQYGYPLAGVHLPAPPA
jgi:hypothetical protein